MTSRQIRICGDIAIVPLTRGYEAIIDASDAPMFSGRLWSVGLDRGRAYAYGWCSVRRRSVSMHRMLMNFPSDAFVDHKDGNGLNNRRSNLRLCDAFQNQHNCKIARNNKSGHKGVHWHKSRQRWRATIRVNGSEPIYLGYFDTPEQAGAAYKEAAEKLFGAFAAHLGVLAKPIAASNSEAA